MTMGVMGLSISSIGLNVHYRILQKSTNGEQAARSKQGKGPQATTGGFQMSIPRWAYRIGSVAGSNLQTASGAVVHGLTKAGIPHINNKTSVVEAYTEEC